jgi:group II intron reverse transcriptase/maturase
MQNISNKYLGIVENRGKRNLPLKRVYSNICNTELFLVAYHLLASNEGATTKGTDNDTIDSMSINKIENIIDKLKHNKYRPKPSRRVLIPKPDGRERPLGLPSWTDKIIQKVVSMILESYYEPIFSIHSHGFRPNRGCHTALEEISINWTGTKWFIEGDIKGCFDNINHKILLKLLKSRIDDDRLIKLIRMWLKAGYMQDWKYNQTYSGTPQGGVISPLLANIYLHELDIKLDELSTQWTKGDKRKGNPEYVRLMNKLTKAKRKGDIDTYKEMRKELNQRKSQGLRWSDPIDNEYRRFRFVRYADDFIIGFVGNKQEAETIKEEIRTFLKEELSLTLSDEKTKITNATNGKARFLSYDIYTQKSRNRPSINGRIRLDIPQDIFYKWKDKYTKKGKAYHRPYYLELSDYMIIRAYDSEFRGLVNYYIMAQNVALMLYKLKYYAKTSACKTLSAKHRITVNKVIRKYSEIVDGRRILKTIVERKDKPPLIATAFNYPIKWVKFPVLDRISNDNDNVKGMQILGKNTTIRSDLLTRLSNDTCEVCGKIGDIEVHHIRKMKDLDKSKEGWHTLMSSMRRKTLITCKSCHIKIHNGQYDGKRLY